MVRWWQGLFPIVREDHLEAPPSHPVNHLARNRPGTLHFTVGMAKKGDVRDTGEMGRALGFSFSTRCDVCRAGCQIMRSLVSRGDKKQTHG